MAIPRVRRLTLRDLDTVIQIQGNCYSTSLIEPIEAMHQHIASGHPCWLVEVADRPAGYLLAARLGAEEAGPPHPISLGTADRPPPSESANWLYLHDLAVLPEFRGTGASRALLDAADRLAQEHHRIEAMALVAVQASSAFWQKQGFMAVTGISEALGHKLTSYGPHAVYMWRPL